ncbi:hypothetical protein [Dokdonella sp.]|uniref:hypothetical protein n=1 Tax=Dokdonella sp. TaxID=2291710 RepID=UPI003C3AD680
MAGSIKPDILTRARSLGGGNFESQSGEFAAGKVEHGASAAVSRESGEPRCTPRKLQSWPEDFSHAEFQFSGSALVEC